MLRLTHISKRFPGGTRPVLDNIHLHLQRGDLCVLIGANGSGKSTLLKVISGELVPDEGNVWIQGDSDGKDRSQLVAEVTQDVNQGTVPDMTLFENLALSQMRLQSRLLSFYRQRKLAILRQVQALCPELEPYLYQPLSTLSGGQRQTVATLMAMTSKAKIVLLDEHTSALDPQAARRLMRFTEQAIQEAGLTGLMITHRMTDAIQYGNRLLMLHEGRVVLDLSGDEKASLTPRELLVLFQQHCGDETCAY